MIEEEEVKNVYSWNRLVEDQAEEEAGRTKRDRMLDFRERIVRDYGLIEGQSGALLGY